MKAAWKSNISAGLHELIKKDLQLQEKHFTDELSAIPDKWIKEAEELKKQEAELKTLANNPFQPIPKLIEVETTVNREKKNEDVAADEIQICMTGGQQLANCGADYIKYKIAYEEGQVIQGHFNCKQAELVVKHKFQTANL